MIDEVLGLPVRQVKSPLTNKMLQPLDQNCRFVQFDSLLTDSDFERLAASLKHYPNVGLRAFGGASTTTIHDLEFLKFFPDLRHFKVDV